MLLKGVNIKISPTKLSRLSLLLATDDCLDLTERPDPDTTLTVSNEVKLWSRLLSKRSLSSLKWSAYPQNAFLAHDLVSES